MCIRDRMNLINSDESQRLLENCKVIKQISGGSSANTVVSLAELGNHVQFIGRVKNDQFGNFFSEDIKKSKTIFNTPPTIEGSSTAHSIILVLDCCAIWAALIKAFLANSLSHKYPSKYKYLLSLITVKSMSFGSNSTDAPR